MKQMTEPEARVWLAELVGWVYSNSVWTVPDSSAVIVRTYYSKTKTSAIKYLPNPFTDANDDFALRDRVSQIGWPETASYTVFAACLFDISIEEYKTGDIARDVLSAHGFEVKEDD